MTFARLLAGVLVASLASAQARAADDVSDALPIQVGLWLDRQDVARAVAISRRGVQLRPDDPAWHRARLDALHAAGMDAWIDVEYGGRKLAPDVALVFARWQVDVGRRDDLDPGLQGPQADVARALLALSRGNPAQADVLVRAGPVPLELEVAWLLHAGDDKRLAALVGTLDPASLPSLAPLAGALDPARTPRFTRTDKALRALADRALSTGSLVGALRVAELGTRARDKSLLEAASAQLETKSGPSDLRAFVGDFLGAPEAWTIWQAPERPSWGAAMLDAVARTLARRESPELPWTRPAEARAIADRLAEVLVASGRAELAGRVLQRWAGACAPPVWAETLVLSGRGAEARRLAVEGLLHCVGGTDLEPHTDPAAMDVEAWFDHTASAWRAFGRIADLGGWRADSALAFGIAARLAPDPDTVALARARVSDADLEVDATGLPTPAALLDRMAQAPWLRPEPAVLATRARAAKARTLALLDPTPEHLDAARLPSDLCLATLRDRCAREAETVREAWRRAGRTPPSPVEGPSDPGAARAASLWLDRLAQAWFLRKAALARALGDDRGTVDVDALVHADSGVRVGRPVPRWQTEGIRSVDLQGKAVVIAFWASWCGPCYAELPLLDALAGRWSADGLPVRVLAISVDEDERKYRRALSRIEWQELTMLRDDTLRRPFRVDTLPTTLLIDQAGVLRDLHTGYDGGDLGELDQAVRTWARLASRDQGK